MSDKYNVSRRLIASLFYIFVIPTFISLFLLIIEKPTFVNKVNLAEVTSEFLLSFSLLSWIVIVAFANLEAITYRYIIAGFSLMSAAAVADLLDEFIQSESTTINLFENFGFPIGLFLASIGLFLWSKQHKQLVDKLDNERLKWKRNSFYDSLTGLLNQRFFYEKIPSIVSSKEQNARKIYLLLIDVDNFKSVNDTYGHPVGDDLLRLIGLTIQSFLRKDDLGFRMGGEEFAILMHDANEQTCIDAAERLRKNLSQIEVITDEEVTVTRTVSIGISNYLYEEDIPKWIKRTDQALYKAKNSGKDQINTNILEQKNADR